MEGTPAENVVAIPLARSRFPDTAVAADKPREEAVQAKAVQDQVLSRMDPKNTESRQFADVHGMIRIPDKERERMVM